MLRFPGAEASTILQERRMPNVKSLRERDSLRSSFLGGSALSLVRFLAGGTSFGQGPGGPVPVKAAALAQRKIAAGQPFVGTVMPLRRSTVGSAVAGRIVAFKHKEGDYVKEGE